MLTEIPVISCSANIQRLEELPEKINSVSASLLGFTEGMQSLFTTADASDCIYFKNLRNIVCSDAITYFNVVAPYSKSLFRSIHQTFEMYQYLETIDDFVENVDDLLVQVKQLICKLDLCLQLHKATYATATMRSMNAEKLVAKLNLEKETFEELAEEHRKNAEKFSRESKDNNPPLWWLFIPVAGLIGYTVYYVNYKNLSSKADTELKKKISCYKQSDVMLLSVQQIQGVLVPALANYLNNLTDIITVLNLFANALETVSSRSQQLKQKESLYLFKIAKANCEKVMNSSICMLSYYDLCESRFRACQAFKDSKVYITEWERDNLCYDDLLKTIRNLFSLSTAWSLISRDTAYTDVIKRIGLIKHTK